MTRVLPVLLLAALAGCLTDLPSVPAPGPAAIPRLTCGELCRVPIDVSDWRAWEPAVAVHPTNPEHVVVASRTGEMGTLPGQYSGWFDLYVTQDGGRTWTRTSLRNTQAFGTGDSVTDPNMVGDPVLAFLPDGTLLIGGATLQYLGAPGGAGVLAHVKLYVARSPDGGFHVGEPWVLAESQGAAVSVRVPGVSPVGAAALTRIPDKPWLATGPDGTALMAWVDLLVFPASDPTANRHDIVLSESRDGGRTWGPSQLVARGGSFTGPAPAIGADGSWYVAFHDFETLKTRVAVSHDQGRSWDVRVVAPSLWMPSLAVGSRAGHERVYLIVPVPAAGPSGTDAAPDAQIQEPALLWSDDGGLSWSDPLLLEQPTRPGRALVSVAVDASGTAFATYARAEADAKSSYHAAALLADGTLLRLPLDPAIAAPGSALGDYLGLAAGSSGAFAAWVRTDDGQGFDVAGSPLDVRPGG